MKTNNYNLHLPVKGMQPDLVTFDSATPFFDIIGPANVPSTFGLFTSPLTFYEAAKEAHDAQKNADHETMLDTGIQFVAQPLTAFYSLINIAHYIASALLFFSVIARSESLRILSFSSGLIGSAICVLQGLFESVSLSRTIRFRKNMNYDLVERLESIDKLADRLKANERPANLLEAMTKIQAFIASPKHKNELISIMGKESFNALTELLESGRKEYIQTIKIDNITTTVFQKGLELLDNQARRPLYRKNMRHIAAMINPSDKQLMRIGKKINEAYHNGSPDSAPKYKEKFDDSIKSIKNANFKRLARRIQPWLAAEIRDCETLIIDGLKDPNQATKDQTYKLVGRLLQLTDEQTKKLVITNICGIAAVAFYIPAIVCFPLLAISALFGAARYIISAGYLGSRGWEFRKENLVPIPIRKQFRKAKELYKNPPRIKNWKIVHIKPEHYDFPPHMFISSAA